MRKTLLISALLLAAPAGAQNANLTNDLPMKTDIMIRDGDLVVVGPDGHVTTMAPSAERRKALEADFVKRGVEVKSPVMLMLREGKLWRMGADATQDQPESQKGLTVK